MIDELSLAKSRVFAEFRGMTLEEKRINMFRVIRDAVGPELTKEQTVELRRYVLEQAELLRV